MQTTIVNTGTPGSPASAGRSARRRAVVASLVLPLLLVAQACGGGDDSAQGDGGTGTETSRTRTSKFSDPGTSLSTRATTAQSSTTATTGSTTTTTGSTTTTTRREDDGVPTVTNANDTTSSTQQRKRKIKYPTGGPRGPVIPPGDEAYEWLAEGKCQRLLDRTATWEQEKVLEVDILLYRGAASACLSDWKTAIADLTALRERHRDVPDGEPEPVKCGDDDDSACQRCRQIVFQWLSDVVDAHESDPEATLVFIRSTDPSLCPDPDPDATQSSTEEQPG